MTASIVPTECPHCDAPIPRGFERCPLTKLHARQVCHAGLELWARMAAADAEGARQRARNLAALFYSHRARCEACNAEVR